MADAAARYPPAGIAIEYGVGVCRVAWVHGDPGNVAVGQSGRVDLVPGPAVVGCDARREGRAWVAAPGHPGGVDDLAAVG